MPWASIYSVPGDQVYFECTKLKKTVQSKANLIAQAETWAFNLDYKLTLLKNK